MTKEQQAMVDSKLYTRETSGEASFAGARGSANACADEIASEYTHTKYTDGIAKIIAKHFPELPEGKQTVSEAAIAWLYTNHPVAYRGFYDRVDWPNDRTERPMR